MLSGRPPMLQTCPSNNATPAAPLHCVSPEPFANMPCNRAAPLLSHESAPLCPVIVSAVPSSRQAVPSRRPHTSPTPVLLLCHKLPCQCSVLPAGDTVYLSLSSRDQPCFPVLKLGPHFTQHVTARGMQRVLQRQASAARTPKRLTLRLHKSSTYT